MILFDDLVQIVRCVRYPRLRGLHPPAAREWPRLDPSGTRAHYHIVWVAILHPAQFGPACVPLTINHINLMICVNIIICAIKCCYNFCSLSILDDVIVFVEIIYIIVIHSKFLITRTLLLVV